MILLVVFGNLLILAFGIAQAFLFAAVRYNAVILGALALAVLAAHTVAAKLSRRRFERRHGISAKRYILYGAVPAAAISVIVCIALSVLMRFGITGVLLPYYIDTLPFDWIFSLFAAGYSVAFLAAQAVALAREIW